MAETNQDDKRDGMEWRKKKCSAIWLTIEWIQYSTVEQVHEIKINS